MTDVKINITGAEQTMPRFMYLFRRELTDKLPSPEEMQQGMKKWMGWMEDLKNKGHIQRGGERLDPSGKVVKGTSKSITDGPYVEVKDSVQGYLIVEAQDIDQAIELSRGCPVLEGGGSVEIRPIMSM